MGCRRHPRRRCAPPERAVAREPACTIPYGRAYGEGRARLRGGRENQGISGRHDDCSPGGRAATTRHKENRHEAHHPSRPPGPRTGKHGAEPALAPAPTDLAALAADAERASAALHPELSVALELDGVPEVRADAARLRRVLANLALASVTGAGAAFEITLPRAVREG